MEKMPLPRIIHRIWIGPPLTNYQIFWLVDARQHVPRNVELWLWTTRTSMPYLGYGNIIVRNLDSLWPLLANMPFPRAHLHSAFAREASGEVFHNYAAVSDIARLLVLYLYGGVYLDMDVPFKDEIPNLFDGLADIGQRLGILRFTVYSYGNSVLASMPRTEAVSMCLNEICRLYTSRPNILGSSGNISWSMKRGYGQMRMYFTMLMTGPRLIFNLLKESGLLLKIDEQQYFYPINTSGCSYTTEPEPRIGHRRYESSSL